MTKRLKQYNRIWDFAASQQLCHPEFTSVPCNSAPLSLLSPWYKGKGLWNRVVAAMTSLTAHESIAALCKAPAGKIALFLSPKMVLGLKCQSRQC